MGWLVYFRLFYARITSIQIIDIFLTLLDMSAKRVFVCYMASTVGLHLGEFFFVVCTMIFLSISSRC